MSLLHPKTVVLLAVIGVGALFSGSAALADDPTGKCGYYTTRSGEQVPRPCGNWRNDATPPTAATARCRDGSWSWSRHSYFWGTCSYHGGVENYR
jgi:hypothetical protein